MKTDPLVVVAVSNGALELETVSPHPRRHLSGRHDGLVVSVVAL